MSDDLNAQIKIGADASGVEAGVGKAKRSLADLGQAAKRTGQEGGAGLAPIGASATEASKKVEAATRNTVQSIQRQIAMFEAGSKSAREYQESIARQRGVDVNALKPYLDQLDAAKAKQLAAANASEFLAAGINAVKFAVVAAAAAASAWVLKINSGVDALNDLKDATGASIENISALENIGARTGTSFETVSTALIKFNQALSTAKPGSDTEKAILAIGLSVKELKALDPAEAFQKVAIALNGFEDDANKARLTQELFGKSLKEVAPLLKDTAEAGKLVATVTTAQAEAAELFNKQLFAFQKNSQDASRALLNELLPALINVTQELNVGTKNAGGFLNAILLIGTTNPFNTLTENVQKYREQIAGLEDDKNRYLKAGSDTRAIDEALQAAKQRLAYFQELRQLQNEKYISASDQTGAEAQRLGLGGPRRSVGDPFGDNKAALDAAKKELEEQAKLIEELRAQSNGFTATFAKDMDSLGKAYQRGAISLADLVELDALLLAKQPGNIAATKAREEAQKALSAAQIAAATASNKELFALRESNDALRLKNETIGLSEDALDALVLKRMDLTIAVQEGVVAEYADVAAMDELNGTRNANIEVMQREIDKLDELRKARNLTANGQTKEAASKVAKDIAKEWQRGLEETDRIARDVFVNWDGSLKSLGDTLRKSLLSAIYDITAKPIIFELYAAVTGSSAKGGTSGSALDIFSGDGFANKITDSANKLGDVLSKSNSEYAKTIGDFLGQNSKQIGEYAKQAGAAFNYLEALSNFKDGSYGKSIGQALGQYFGGPIGGQIGKEIGSFVDRLFGKGEYVQSTGEAGATFSNTGSILDRQGAQNSGGVTGDNSAFDFTKNLNSSYIDAAAKLGIKAAETFFYFGGNNSDGGKFRIGASVAGTGQVFDSQETSAKDGATKLAAQRAVFAALQASELPAYLSKVFDGINASSATEDQITAALDFAGSLKQVREALLETRTPLQILQDAVSSSFTSLGTSAETFKTDFVAAIDAGITPDKLVLWQQLGVNLDQLAAASGEAADGVEKATRSLTDIANERKNLQDQLDELTLTNAELLAKQRNALDESNQALFDQVQSAKAAKTATQELADAQAAMVARISDALGGLGDTRFALENELLGLQGKGSEVDSRNRTRDLAKLTEGVTNQADIDRITAAYDYNRGLEQQIETLKQSKAAAEESARAQEQAAESASRAAEQIKTAWQSVTDSLLDEVARIRGSLGSPDQNYAAAQAKFSITAAQAAAGDQTAAKALPELSRAMLSLAEADASSLSELSFIQARTAGTLEEIGKKFAAQFGLQIPQFAVGTNFVPQDMLAVIHKGEAIIPEAYNPSASGTQANTDRLEALVEVLISRVEALEAPISRTADATEDAAETLDSATEGGNAMRSIVMEPLPV